MYWDVKHTKSYHALFNFIIGNRGAGKTYGKLKDDIEQHLKVKKTENRLTQFMYVRRYKEELKKLTTQNNGRLFNAVKREFPGHELSARGNVLICDGEIMGYAQALSTANILKSDAFPDVEDLIFDEFIIDKGTYHYLHDEVDAFLELYQTIDRDRDIPAWFLSNAVSVNNPYFTYFDLQVPYNKLIERKSDILVQLVQDPELIAKKKATRLGHIIEGSKYADYAIENKFLRDDESFVGKKPLTSEYFFTLNYYEHQMGIWRDSKQGLYYISSDINPQCKIVYAATTDDHKPNTMLLKGYRGSVIVKELMRAYNCGAIRYESIKLKSWYRDIVKMSL